MLQDLNRRKRHEGGKRKSSETAVGSGEEESLSWGALLSSMTLARGLNTHSLTSVTHGSDCRLDPGEGYGAYARVILRYSYMMVHLTEMDAWLCGNPVEVNGLCAVDQPQPG